MAFLYVKAYYGPCNTFNACIHKPGMVNGIKDRLLRLGYRVDIQPVDFENYLMLEMCGHEVFRCNIKSLKFNTYYRNDKVCERAVQAVLNSSVKFRRARSYLWTWMSIDYQMFKRGKYAPKDYWIKDNITPGLAVCEKCITCCDLLVAKREDDKG